MSSWQWQPRWVGITLLALPRRPGQRHDVMPGSGSHLHRGSLKPTDCRDGARDLPGGMVIAPGRQELRTGGLHSPGLRTRSLARGWFMFRTAARMSSSWWRTALQGAHTGMILCHPNPSQCHVDGARPLELLEWAAPAVVPPAPQPRSFSWANRRLMCRNPRALLRFRNARMPVRYAESKGMEVHGIKAGGSALTPDLAPRAWEQPLLPKPLCPVRKHHLFSWNTGGLGGGLYDEFFAVPQAIPP